MSESLNHSSWIDLIVSTRLLVTVLNFGVNHSITSMNAVILIKGINVNNKKIVIT